MKIALGFIAVLFIVAAGWYLASPLFFDKTIDEEFPFKEMTTEEKTVLNDEMPSEEPAAVLRGSFTDADSFHKGSGEATVYKLPDGMQVLRLENFTVTNGPDLRVLLAVDSNPANSVELGKLKGNIGDQNYEIAASVDASAYNSVIIYCKPFQVIFSTATLLEP